MTKRFSQLISPSPKTAAIGLHAVNGIISANIFIYVTALFLTSYPASWIPYFFIGRTFIEVITSFLVTPFLSRQIIRNSLLFQTGSILFVLAFAMMLSKSWYSLPLIFSFILTIAGLISALISWNSVRNAFDIIEFKQISPALPIASVIGKIVLSLCNTLLIKKFGIAYLPFLTVAMLLLSCLFIIALKPLPIIISAPKHGRSPIRYPLFVNLFIFSFILAFCYTLVDYTLRIKLASAYDSQQIGQFISIFTAVTYFISTVVTLTFSKPLIKFGISNLLEILPIYWVILPIAVMIYPDMALIALMGAGDYVFYNFINLGRALLLNVLPNEIRAVGQMAIQTVAESVGIGIASLFLILIAKHITIPRIAIIIAVFDLFLVFFARRLKSNYVTTLKDEIFLKRFSVDDTDVDAYQDILEENIIQSLDSADRNSIRFGYSLLSTVKMQKFPEIILKHIRSDQRDIRIEAIKAVIVFNEQSSISLLLDLFKTETDPEVKWWIINALAEFQPGQFIKEAHDWLNDATPEVKAAAIRVLFFSENSEDIDHAATELSNMMQQSDTKTRRIAARILTKIPLAKINTNLPDFIADSDDVVSSYAIDAILKNEKFEFAPAIISRLAKGGVYFSARKIINKLNEEAIPLLMKVIIENKDNIHIRINILVTVLAQMVNEAAEKSLAILAEHKEPLLRQIVAFESINRARHFRITDEFIQKALQFAHEEAELYCALQQALKKYPEKHISNEIMARSNLALERYLCWVGVYYSSTEIYGLIPTILSGMRLEKAKAIELLITIILDRNLVDITMAIFSDKKLYKSRGIIKPVESYFDAWLTQVINTPFTNEDGLSMNNMQKVFVLRQDELFKNLPAETLMIIAEETQLMSMSANQVIFAENDPPTGLYIIAAGHVNIVRHGQLLVELKENNFFGELALIDNAPRAATAVAITEGTLLFLNKETFERITNDLPQVLRSVTQAVLGYLRSTLAKQ